MVFDGRGGVHGQALERGKQRVVHEVQQRVAGHALAGLVVRPIRPAAGLRDDGFIIVLVKLPVLLLGVIDLEKQHPRDLLDALRVAVDARVVAHDVAQTLYKSG